MTLLRNRPSMKRSGHWPIGHLLAVFLLAACTPTASGVAVPEPLVITVVVTPGGAEPPAATAPTPGTTLATPSYPPPLQNGLTAVYQPFERGFMIYLPDRQAVWVFVHSIMNATGTPTPTQRLGAWLAFSDTFKEGEPEIDPTLVAPNGLLQPKRGFGKVWRENPDVHGAVGWALEYEFPYATVVIDYPLGALDAAGNYTPRSFIHTVLTPEGTWVHIDEAARLWSKP